MANARKFEPHQDKPRAPTGKRAPGLPIEADVDSQLLVSIVAEASCLRADDRILLLRLARLLSEGEESFRQALSDILTARTAQQVESYAVALMALQDAVAHAQAVRSTLVIPPAQTNALSPLEAVLADDWLGPEEDEAWRDL